MKLNEKKEKEYVITKDSISMRSENMGNAGNLSKRNRRTTSNYKIPNMNQYEYISMKNKNINSNRLIYNHNKYL